MASTSSFDLTFRLTGPTESTQSQDSDTPDEVFTVGGHLTTYRIRVTLSVVPENAGRLLEFLTAFNTSGTVTRTDLASLVVDCLQPDTMLMLSMYQLSKARDKKLFRGITETLRDVLAFAVAPYGLRVEGLRVSRRPRQGAIQAAIFVVSVSLLAGATLAVLVLPGDLNRRTELTDWLEDLFQSQAPAPPPTPAIAAITPVPIPTPNIAATVVAMVVSSRPTPAIIPTVTSPPIQTRKPVPIVTPITITPFPIVTPLPVQDEYNISSVSMNLKESGEGTFTADWSVTVENVAAISAIRAMPIYMSIDGSTPEWIGLVSGVQRGDAETFVFSATVDSQASRVDFSVGDAHYQVSLDDLLADRTDSTSEPGLASPDRAALVELYNSTGGDNWADNTNWLSQRPIDQWYGVEVDSNGRVTALDLNDNGLSGAIPTSLGDLTELSTLVLSANRLTGSIPPQLGNLPNLRVLILWGNQLTGSIPYSLAEMDKLEAISLEGNLLLTGCIPDGLRDLEVQYGKFSELDTLGLPYCNSTELEAIESLIEEVMEQAARLKASFQGFLVITTELDEYGNHDLECRSLSGGDYRLADWNDLKDYHSSGGSIDALIAGLDWKDEKTSDVGVRHPRVSRDGSERYNGGRRHYFVSRHDHVPPSYFLVHDDIENYHLSLGSWYGEGGEILCIALGESRIHVSAATGLGSQSPPRADAGPDQSVRPGDLVTLDASGSSPDTTYFWEMGVVGVTGCELGGGGCNDYVHSQLTLSDPTSQTPTFTAPDLEHGATRYKINFELTVTRDGLSSSDVTSVEVAER